MSKKYPHGKGPVKWVDDYWLAEHLDDKIMILDTQPNVHDYIQEHIPGARYMNQGLLRVPMDGLPAQYVQPEIIQMLFRRLGLKKDIPVVVYTGKGPFKGWGDGLEQTMVSYTLVRFGHDNVYVLDGGIDKWKDKGKPLEQTYPDVSESDFGVEVRSDYFIGFDEFKELKDKDNVIVLDARPADVYEGQGPWRKPGHIPGAVNLPWKSLMEDINPTLLKSDSDIRSILDKHGVSQDKQVVCSCGTGREATNEFNLLNFYLSFPKVKIYEGSFTEWVARDQETVTGKNPR
ncbi:sulfurtransferase [candidate division WOR-3 bacterium]|uniref:Sulfurtransferase n=1 Tax=candidate division WOR-3 bacterium TaxID=2052148 RepID=A0A9D5QDI3_UNCW3|nr:sulfurtransferase [candidate division WOR-3 bacterium]MBD3365127.1 sulfurtransferase [candidate division WOR-3 bacterium]